MLGNVHNITNDAEHGPASWVRGVKTWSKHHFVAYSHHVIMHKATHHRKFIVTVTEHVFIFKYLALKDINTLSSGHYFPKM